MGIGSTYDLGSNIVYAGLHQGHALPGPGSDYEEEKSLGFEIGIRSKGNSNFYYDVAFSNTSNDPVDYTWGNGSEARFQSFESEKPQRVTFGQTPPDKITIQLSTGGHHVSHVSMVDVQHPTVNLVTNPAFDQIESTTYTVDLWLEVSNDTRVIPADATGWIEGFNYNEIYGT